LSAGAAEAADFNLMILGSEMMQFGEFAQSGFEEIIFWQGGHLAAVRAGQMVMVVIKFVSQLNLIFPTYWQALHNADLLEQLNGTVDGGAVQLAVTGRDQLAHAHGFAIEQGMKNGLTRGGQAGAVRF
jgi:hypothetical protein